MEKKGSLITLMILCFKHLHKKGNPFPKPKGSERAKEKIKKNNNSSGV